MPPVWMPNPHHHEDLLEMFRGTKLGLHYKFQECLYGRVFPSFSTSCVCISILNIGERN